MLIILPGYSSYNRRWANDLKKDIGFKNTYVHAWRHWERGFFSLKFELESLFKKIEKTKSKKSDKKIYLIAKSVGTGVCMYLLQMQNIKFEKVILCGIPINGFSQERKDLFRKGIKAYPSEKIAVFQNEKDNLGPFKKVNEFIKSVDKEITVNKMPRSDHSYPYPEEFKSFLTKK